MSVCNNCYNAGQIDSCSTGFAFNFSVATENFRMFVQHNGTGRIQVFDVEYLISGVYEVPDVIIDPLQGYTIWFSYGQLSDAHIEFNVFLKTYTCIDIYIVNSNFQPTLATIL